MAWVRWRASALRLRIDCDCAHLLPYPSCAAMTSVNASPLQTRGPPGAPDEAPSCRRQAAGSAGILRISRRARSTRPACSSSPSNLTRWRSVSTEVPTCNALAALITSETALPAQSSRLCGSIQHVSPSRDPVRPLLDPFRWRSVHTTIPICPSKLLSTRCSAFQKDCGVMES